MASLGCVSARPRRRRDVRSSTWKAGRRRRWRRVWAGSNNVRTQLEKNVELRDQSEGGRGGHDVDDDDDDDDDAETSTPASVGGALLRLAGSLSLASTVVMATSVAQGARSAWDTALSSRTADFPPGPSGEYGGRLLRDCLGELTALDEKYGGVCSVQVAGNRLVIVTQPDIAAYVLREYGRFVKAGTALLPSAELVGNGMLTSDGSLWRRQRRNASPAFRRAAVRMYADAVTETSSAVTSELWGSVSETTDWTIDIYKGVNEMSLRAVMRCLFGVSSSSSAPARMGGGAHRSEARVREAITEAFQSLSEIGATTGALPAWLPTPATAKVLSAVRKLDTIVTQLIREKKRERLRRRFSRAASAVPSTEPSDLLSALIDSFYDRSGSDGLPPGDDVDETDEDENLLDQQLRDELLTLLVAGQETSALTVTWALTFLAQDPELAAMVAAEAELASVHPPADQMAHMPIAQAVILEALRLHPPAYIVGRATSEANTQLGKYVLDKGTTVLIAPYVMHRSEKFWGEHALNFEPRRWLDDPSRSAAGEEVLMPSALTGLYREGAYIPFGSGPRNCVGAMFAMMETTLMVGEVCRQFHIGLPPGTTAPPQPRTFVTLRPEGDSVMLALRRRIRE